MIDGYQITWLGWNNQDTSDKVWGHLEMDDGRYYAFWGRRGKTLRFKLHTSYRDLSKLQNSKEKKGYLYVAPQDYNKLVQDFLTELEINCMTAILAETVM